MNPTLVEIMLTMNKHKVMPEYQGVTCVEGDTMYLMLPYKPEDAIWCVFRVLHPEKTPEQLEAESQQYLKRNKEVYDYLANYLARV